MNLANETLVPFKTKAIRRDGALVVYCGRINTGRSRPEYAFFQASGENGDDSMLMLSVGHDGLCVLDEERPLDIVRLIRPWEPARGDVVRFKGLLARADGRDFIRIVTDRELTLEEAHRDPGFYYVTFQGERYLGYKGNMRLVRRAGSS